MFLRNAEDGFGAPAKFLHWTVALMIFSLFILAQLMHGLPTPEQDPAIGPYKWLSYDLHKSIGITVFFLVLARLLWRQINPVLRPPDGMARWQRHMARASHRLFYVAMVVMPITGWLGSKAGGFKATWFWLWEPPDLFGRDDKLNFYAEAVHTVTAYFLVCLIAVHVSAALWHHFIRRDDVLRRMWPAGFANRRLLAQARRSG